MSLLIVLGAAILAAISNFFLRKNQENKGSSLGYLVHFYLFSLLICFFLAPRLFSTSWSPVLTTMGGIAGALNVLMMILTARALLTGPPGLTFAFQNAGAIFPSFFLFFLFGPTFDFYLSSYHLIGVLALLIGLYLGARTKNNAFAPFKKWILYASSTFFIQGIILSIFQWRCLLFSIPSKEHPFIPWSCLPEEDVWFIPGFFIVATLLMSLLFIFKERRFFRATEFFYGMLGGVFNGATTFLLLLATNYAVAAQKAILFPFFAVGVIFFCSVWGKALYQEKVNWFAIALCIFGVFFSLI